MSDAAPALPIRFRPAAAPVVTAVVVTWNAPAWTGRCLAALAATATLPLEVVIVDNGSDAATGSLLAAVEGATVLRNVRNLGFGVAVGQAVERARAPHLLLLNSDAVVAPGWDVALVAALAGDPSAAAASARLLHPDGRLQEAGAVLWRDGTSEAYGDGDRPDRPEYRFRRRVDHASAACLLVRRADFLDAGGFDPVFHPAYCEDVDLVLTWRRRGRHVLYEPGATAVHAQGASSAGGAAERLVARNRPVLAARHRDLLAHRPERPARDDPPTMLAMRDAGCAERVLVVARSAADDGVAELAETVLGERPSWRVTLVTDGGEPDPAARAALEARGVEVADDLVGPGTWLADRRHHHTAVVALAGADPLMAAVAAREQPDAERIEGARGPSAAAAMLLRSGA